MALPPTDTRLLFRPLSREIVELLRTLNPDDWERPTLAGSWRVAMSWRRAFDTALRRLVPTRRSGPASRSIQSPASGISSSSLNARATGSRGGTIERLALTALTRGRRGSQTSEPLALDAAAMFPVSRRVKRHRSGSTSARVHEVCITRPDPGRVGAGRSDSLAARGPADVMHAMPTPSMCRAK